MEQHKMEKLAEKFDMISKNPEYAMSLAAINGDFIEFMDKDILTKDPNFTAELIKSAKLGYPCEALCAVVNDNNFLVEVAKRIILKNSNDLEWIIEHMFRNDEDIRLYLTQFLNVSKQENSLEETETKTL